MGGEGADLFVYAAGGGHDTVLDFYGAAGDRGLLVGMTACLQILTAVENP